jgi:hypothetical protein
MFTRFAMLAALAIVAYALVTLGPAVLGSSVQSATSRLPW